MKKILIATVKPFAPKAVETIKKIFNQKNYIVELLEKYDNQEQLIEAVSKDINALIVRSDKISREVIEAGKSLEIIVRAGAGYDNIDLTTASEHNIVVMNTPGQNANAVAELAFGMMIYLARNYFQPTAGTELKGKTIGLHGFGFVGKNMARIARGFDMKIYAYDPYIPRKTITNLNINYINNVKELYSLCQYVSLHIPVNDETRQTINYELMARMPENAILINPARKELIDESSLLKIFAERNDFKYITDIAPDCKQEIQEKYPGRFFFTPKKMGAQTKEANFNAGTAAAEQIINFFEKADISYKVN